MYLACYEELSMKLPGPQTALILGDAYMSVQEVSCYIYNTRWYIAHLYDFSSVSLRRL